MTNFPTYEADRREIAEVDALVRALGKLRHWSASAAARKHFGDDLGRRLYASAARLREEARADSLLAAHALFEIDALHDAWINAEGHKP